MEEICGPLHKLRHALLDVSYHAPLYRYLSAEPCHAAYSFFRRSSGTASALILPPSPSLHNVNRRIRALGATAVRFADKDSSGVAGFEELQAQPLDAYLPEKCSYGQVFWRAIWM
jgi:hypothetical protein